MSAPKPDPSIAPIPGLWLCRTPEGIPVLHLYYWADPEKSDPEWAKKERAKYTSEAFWKKEMLGDAHALEGQRVYPEFDVQTHVIEHGRIPKRGCRYMAIDPHPRTPHAFLWLLVDGWNDIYVYREVWNSVVYGESRQLKDTDEENSYTIKEYAEMVALVEGNRLEWHKAETTDEYAVYKSESGGEHILGRYMDQAGKAFKASDEAALLESYARRYSRFGIDCQDPKKAVQSGEDAIRDLLKQRKHDTYGMWPRLHISHRCPELILEFQRHRYKSSRPSDEKELKQEGIESRRHLLDLTRYLVTANLQFIGSMVS